MAHKRSDFITDGYTESGYIAPNGTLHGELRFEYRPMLPESQVELFSAMEKMEPANYKRRCGKEIAERLVSWSLTDPKGAPVKVSPRNVLSLRPSVFNRLFNVIAGIEGGDRDPQQTDIQADDMAADQYESALTETTVGQARAERHAKN